jgi:hypothetical protein
LIIGSEAAEKPDVQYWLHPQVPVRHCKSEYSSFEKAIIRARKIPSSISTRIARPSPPGVLRALRIVLNRVARGISHSALRITEGTQGTVVEVTLAAVADLV